VSCPSCVVSQSLLGSTGRWESQQCTASLYIHPYPPMRLTGFLSEPHTSGETQTLKAQDVSVSNAFQSAAGLFTAVNGPVCRM
jgi:hypothetical protein